MILETVRGQLKDALKKQDEVVLRTLRALLAALEYKRTQKNADLEAEEEIAVVKNEVKKRQEAIEIYTKYQKSDRVNAEAAELEVLQTFLPQQASETEIKAAIDKVKSQLGEGANRGQLIGQVIAKLGKGAVDGNTVARLVASAKND